MNRLLKYSSCSVNNDDNDKSVRKYLSKLLLNLKNWWNDYLFFNCLLFYTFQKSKEFKEFKDLIGLIYIFDNMLIDISPSSV